MQILTESAVVAGAAGLLGLGVGYLAIRLLVAWAPPQLSYSAHMGLQWPVVTVALGAALLSGVMAGALPAARLRSLAPRAALAGDRGPRPSRTWSWLGAGGLVVFQTALTTALLLVGGLLGRSYFSLQRVTPGFSPAGVLALSIALPGDRYESPESLWRFYSQVTEEIARLPGVTTVSAATDLPSEGASCSVTLEVEGRSRPLAGEVACLAVAPGYHQALEIPLLRGRSFEAADYGPVPGGVLINATLAERLWPGEDPLARTLTLTGGRRLRPDEHRVAVLGVLGDVRQTDFEEEPVPLLYLPELWHNMTILVRSDVEPMALADAARAALWSVDSRQPIYRLTTLSEVLGAATAGARFNAVLVGCSALICLVVAALGIFGVLAQQASQRRWELAVRRALGASAGRVLWSLLGRALALTGMGLLLGLAAAAAFGGLLGSLLFGIEPHDPVSAAMVVVVMVGAALVASLGPARRAAAADPMAALRGD